MNLSIATIVAEVLVGYAFALSCVLTGAIYGLPFAPIFVICHKRMRTNPEKKARYIVTMSIICLFLAILVAGAMGVLIDMNIAPQIYHNGVADLIEILTGASV